MRSRHSPVVIAVVALFAGALGVAPRPVAHAAQTLIITNTDDPSRCPDKSGLSLRCAIEQANTDGSGDYIEINIPSGTPGCDVNGVCTIEPLSALPQLTADYTTIEGINQPGSIFNTNGLAAGDNEVIKVRLDGASAGNAGVDGLQLGGTHDSVLGLSLTRWERNAIAVTGTWATITSTFIGLAPDGTVAGNFFGVSFNGGGADTVGGTTPRDFNVISGNYGPGVNGSCTSNNHVEGNLIGTNLAGTAAAPNGNAGIFFDDVTCNTAPPTIGGAGNLINNNVISGNSGDGLDVYGGTTTTVTANWIGVTASMLPLPNTTNGVYAYGGAQGAIIGPTNVIAHNTGAGVLVGCDSNDHTQVQISQNRTYANGGAGIVLSTSSSSSCTDPSAGAPNDNTPYPVITAASPTAVSGTACANCTVEVFGTGFHPDGSGYGQGQTYVGNATADSSGHWSMTPSTAIMGWVTATATTASSPAETSAFAQNVQVTTNIAVNTTADGYAPNNYAPYSPCLPTGVSLHCAIDQANLDGYGDTIDFAIPSSDSGCDGTTHVCTIVVGQWSPPGALPALSANQTLIDGYTQPGSHPNTNASLSAGDNAAIKVYVQPYQGGWCCDGIQLAGTGDSVRGLAIGDFGEAGIGITGSDDTVAGDFIGTRDGTNANGNYHGVEIVRSSQNVIGGTSPADVNLISGNRYGIQNIYVNAYHPAGVDIIGGAQTGLVQNVVEGNLIGTNAAGTASLANGDGVILDGTSGTAAANNVMGGTTATARNVISGNLLSGVFMPGNATDNVIEGNDIGTSAAGSAAVPNGNAGVFLATDVGGGGAETRPTNNTIGGTTPGAGNVMSGNAYDGVALDGFGFGGDGNMVSGNLIGLGADGVTLVGNGGNSVEAFGGAYGDDIADNTIAYNADAGVGVDDGMGLGVTGGQSSGNANVQISQNSIFANGGLGIDLFTSVVGGPVAGEGTVTCSGPRVGAPNDSTPCPIIQSVTTSGVSGMACDNCIVEVYLVGSPPDSSGHGEGKTYVGSVTAGPSGAWSLPIGIDPTRYSVTATATQPATGSSPAMTSEFSADEDPVVSVLHGWNLIDIPVQSTDGTLSDLLNDLNAGGQLGSSAVIAAATYAGGRFTLYVPGYSANAALGTSQGVFVLSTRAGVWRPGGSLYTTAQSVPLQSGWNLVAAPYPLNGLTSDVVASEVNAAGCTVNEIATYGGGSYHTWTPSMPVNAAITVSATAGLWIEASCPNPTRWLPS